MTSSTLTTTSFSSSTPFLPSSSSTSSSNMTRRHLIPSSASTTTVFVSPCSSSSSLLHAKKEVDQARQFISQAERKLKVSLLSLKLRPRHRRAGELYCKAALQLQAAGLSLEASQMLELAATCFKSDQLHVRAAKASELAVQASLQANDAPIAEICRLSRQAQTLYLQAEQVDQAAAVMQVAAGRLLNSHQQEAISLLKEAMELLAGEGRPGQAAHIGSRILRLWSDSPDPPGLKILPEISRIFGFMAESNQAKLLSSSLVLILAWLTRNHREESFARGVELYEDFGTKLTVNSQKFVRGFLEALNDNDEERVEELLISASEAKLDKEVEEMVVQMVNNISLDEKEISGKKEKERNLPKEEASKTEEEALEATKVVEAEVTRRQPLLTRKRAGGILGLAAGTAVLASVVGGRRALVRGPYQDVTGHEHIHPATIGLDEDTFREYRRGSFGSHLDLVEDS